jgi:hypothetical protein
VTLVTFEGGGVALAFTLAGVSVGSWAAFTTWQVRALRKEVCALRKAVQSLVNAIGI